MYLLHPWCCLEKAKVCKSWSVIIYIYICIYITYLQNPTRTYSKLRCTGDAKIKMSEYVCAAKVINNFGTIMGPKQSSPCIELYSSDPNILELYSYLLMEEHVSDLVLALIKDTLRPAQWIQLTFHGSVVLFVFVYPNRSTMKRGSFYIALIFTVSFLPKTYATNRIFSYGKSVSNNQGLTRQLVVTRVTSKCTRISWLTR